MHLKWNSSFRNRDDLKKYQQKRLNRFVKRTLAKSTYYKAFFSKSGFEWSLVPQISKQEFMHSFEEINTQGLKLEESMETALKAEETRDFKSEVKGITVGLSTGTSGKRSLFLASETERAQWVALVMHRIIKPKLFKKQKVAFFLRANSNLYSSVASRLFEFQYFDIFQPLDQLLHELNQFQPHILASQPSILIDISKAQQEKTIQINPEQLISFAEVLHDNDRLTIEKVFNQKITEIYQCTEGFLGVSCQHGTMHLNEDIIHVKKEWVDTDTFHPIITDFTRHSQPVVKYRMDDLLQIKKTPCPCGSPFLAIEKIIGRDDDVLLCEGTKVYPDLIARRIAIRTNSFQKYSINQTGPKKLLIGIECSDLDWLSTKKIFQEALDQLLNENDIFDIQYHFEHNPSFPEGEKMRKIKRTFKLGISS